MTQRKTRGTEFLAYILIHCYVLSGSQIIVLINQNSEY